MKSWLLILCCICLAPWASAQEVVEAPAQEPASFESQVDLSPFNEVAVWQDGRIKSWESFSRSMMQFVSGSRNIDGQSPAFTYLDLALRPEAYVDRPIVFVKKKPMRAAIIQALIGEGRPE